MPGVVGTAFEELTSGIEEGSLDLIFTVCTQVTPEELTILRSLLKPGGTLARLIPSYALTAERLFGCLGEPQDPTLRASVEKFVDSLGSFRGNDREIGQQMAAAGFMGVRTVEELDGTFVMSKG